MQQFLCFKEERHQSEEFWDSVFTTFGRIFEAFRSRKSMRRNAHQPRGASKFPQVLKEILSICRSCDVTLKIPISNFFSNVLQLFMRFLSMLAQIMKLFSRTTFRVFDQPRTPDTRMNPRTPGSMMCLPLCLCLIIDPGVRGRKSKGKKVA